MNIHIMKTTKGEVILELIKIRDEFKKRGVKITKADTYSFTADDGMTISKVYWNGCFIVSDIELK